MRPTLNYATPRTLAPRPASGQKAEHELLCFVKLLQYLVAASVLGSVVSVVVAVVIDWMMR